MMPSDLDDFGVTSAALKRQLAELRRELADLRRQARATERLCENAIMLGLAIVGTLIGCFVPLPW